MSYTEHRRFLHASHPYRRQKKSFNGEQEFGTTPKPLSGSDILKAVNGLNFNWGKKSKSKEVGDKTVWKKKSILFQLEY